MPPEIDDPVDELIAEDMPLERGGRPTLKTISRIAGLGVTTVSRALKDGPELSLETRARVQAIAAEIGYRPDRAGVRLRTGRTFVIGLILDQNVSVAEFERRMILGVSQVLVGTSYHLVVMPQGRDADPMETVRYFVENGAADGLIFTHTRPADARVRYLLDRNFPFISHGRTEFSEPHAFYDFDNERFTIRAIERLRERGRRRLALVPGPDYLACARHIRDGFREAGRAPGEKALVVEGIHLDSELWEFRNAANRLANAADAPDGFICANETGCIALMAGLQDAGLVIGRDVDLIAKSSSDILDHLRPAIDSFHEDYTFAGQELARLLLKRIAGVPASDLQSIAEPRLQRRT